MGVSESKEFTELDKNVNGMVTREEFGGSNGEWAEAMKCDRDNDGQLSSSEYKIVQNSASSRQSKVFDRLNARGDQITPLELKRAFQEKHLHISDDALKHLLAIVDEDGDGEISLTEFRNAIHKFSDLDEDAFVWSTKFVDMTSSPPVYGALGVCSAVLYTYFQPGSVPGAYRKFIVPALMPCAVLYQNWAIQDQ